MSTELNQGSSSKSAFRSTLGNGHFTGGKWYCGCNEAANCRTVTRDTINNGKAFWSCPRYRKNLPQKHPKEPAGVSPEEPPQNPQCNFYLWVEDEDAAKERLGQHSLGPQTPTKEGGGSSDSDQSTIAESRDHFALPQSPESPSINRKRKARPGIDDRFNNHSSDATERVLQPPITLDDATSETGQPPRRPVKAARTLTCSTPGGQLPAENPNNGSLSLPTPNSHGRKSPTNGMDSHLFLRELDSSPAPGRVSQRPILNPEGRVNLAATILNLVRADKPNLKRSTERQIRLEIGLALDVAEVKVRRYEETISLLSEDIDVLERKVDRLEAAAEG